MSPPELPHTMRLAMKGRLLGLLAFTFVSVMAGRGGPMAMQLPAGNSIPADNPIVVENQEAGSNGWLWSTLGDDTAQQIKGYASSTSINQGESLTFYVTVNPAQSYAMDIYRIGWYGGLGGRLRLHVQLDGVQQSSCGLDPTVDPVTGETYSNEGLISCNWAPAYTLTVPSDWTSGVYVALLTNAQGFQNYMTFVVRDGRPAAFFYQHAVATDQAYNNYPDDGQTGKSLYDFNSFGAHTITGGPRAVKVSFDRPFADSGVGEFFTWEIQLVRWLERSGYDVTYSTDLDTHANGDELKRHKAFFSTGHKEICSTVMFDAYDATSDSDVIITL